MKDTDLYRQILGIETPWKVASVDLDPEALRIEVLLSHKQGLRWACPECGELCGLHDHADERSWRHLDSCQFQTFIRARVPRVRCPDHGVRQVKVPWAEPSSRFTLLFEALAVRVLQQTSVSGGAGLLRISWDEASKIMERAVERGLAARGELDVEAIGVDEKSVGRKLGVLTLVYDLHGKRVVHIREGRSKKALGSFFEQLEPHQLVRIKAMAMDMAKPFIAAAEESLLYPEKQIVFDRFHVMQAMNKAVDEVRRAEHKELMLQGDRSLANTMHILRYAEERLPERYAPRLEELKRSNLRAARAWALKESLRGLWGCGSLKKARAFWTSWNDWAIRSRLAPVVKVAQMVKRHITGILNYYSHKITNAVAECTNGVVETIKRKARGYRNLNNLKTAILFHCGGLKLDGMTPGSGLVPR
jgi:transposase